MRQWYSAAEIAEAAIIAKVKDFPTTRDRVRDRAEREAWQSRPRSGRGGGLEYPITALPKPVQRALYRKEFAPSPEASGLTSSPAAPHLAAGTLSRVLPEGGAGLFSNSEGEAKALVSPHPNPLGGEGEIRHDPLLEKRTRQGFEELDRLKPVLTAPAKTRGSAVKELAAATGLTVSTLYKKRKRFLRGGVEALARPQRADVGQRRAIISLAFDRRCPLPPSELKAMREQLDEYIRSSWASGVGGWRQIREHAGLELMTLCHARGWYPSLSECVVPKHVVDAWRHFGLLDTVDKDAKGTYDLHMPDIKRTREGLRPFQLVVGDVHPVDIGLRIPGRSGLVYPRAISWLCVATEMFVCHLVLPEKGESIRRIHVAQSFAHLCQKYSIPETLYLDNGGEYNWDNMLAGFAELSRLTGLARVELGGEKPTIRHQGKNGQPVVRSLPHNPKAKPIEGVFAVLEGAYFKQIPGWVGGNRITKKTQNLGQEPDGFPGDLAALSLDLDTAVERYNNRVGKDGLSPVGRFNRAQADGWRPAQADAAALMLSFADADTRRIRAGRFTWDGVSYYDDRLLGIDGERLVKVAEHDPRLAFVFERKDGGRLICAAAMEPTYGYLEKEGAKEKGRRTRVFREVLADKRQYVFPLVPMDEHRKYLDATREIPKTQDARRVTLSAEAEAMKAAVEKQALDLVEQAGTNSAPLLSQWAQDEDPEVAALRAVMGE
jgi:hypothetical protein